MSRAEDRRRRRAASSAGLTPAELAEWQDGRRLAADHPHKAAEPIFSTKELGLRCLDVVERSGVLKHLNPKFTAKRGNKRKLTVKAFLVCALIAAYLKRSYRRTDIVAVLYGLHPAVAQALGVVDADGQMLDITYNAVIKTARRLERLLRWGFRSGILDCDLEWFAHRMVKASVPRHIRRTVRAVIVDGTAIDTWARTISYNRQGDLDRDAYALHRKKVVDNPDLDEPELKREALAAAARKQGLLVGDDGRIIRGKDPDARAGYATGTAKRKARFYSGYELTVVVASRTIAWQGNPSAYQLGPHVPGYVLAMSLNPAGTNPGPIGRHAVMRARRVAPKIKDVIADRAYTVKRESFVRWLHKRRINVTMDHPTTMITRPRAAGLGKRRQPVINHCGTFVPDWAPANKVVPPAGLRRKGQESHLEQWYNDRYCQYGWRAAGPVKQTRKTASATSRRKVRKRGVQRFQCPVCSGHIAIPNQRAMTFRAPLVPGPASGVCCGGKVNALVEDLDQYQECPYGTTVWKKSYARRPTVEAVIGKLKADEGIGNGACQALGLASYTIAAVAAVVAYNLKLRRVNGHTHTDNTGSSRTDGVGGDAADSDEPGSDTADRHEPGGEAEPPNRAPP